MDPLSIFFIRVEFFRGHLSVRFSLTVPVAPKPFLPRRITNLADVKKIYQEMNKSGDLYLMNFTLDGIFHNASE
ncbi:unnamed protein product [Acanthoscelides obtectus]|uniref:Uncharacterized protein n=1 Tax=Acanthoscelides obtectus TaxID=200917 RepID=A0A9P0KJZ7_ACAOB|nr:unnamed protein product [Acanthoscelides obtectus]CAK1682107.1 hypothetical protein AOBTE_LOCUS33429 [Acanthoscelides obtectus]